MVGVFLGGMWGDETVEEDFKAEWSLRILSEKKVAKICDSDILLSFTLISLSCTILVFVISFYLYGALVLMLMLTRMWCGSEMSFLLSFISVVVITDVLQWFSRDITWHHVSATCLLDIKSQPSIFPLAFIDCSHASSPSGAPSCGRIEHHSTPKAPLGGSTCLSRQCPSS